MAMRIEWDVDKLATDMARRGWIGRDLARAAGVHEMTVSRALRHGSVSARAWARLAGAMGYTVGRYIRGRRQEVA